MNTLVVYQAIVARVDILAKFFAVLVSLVEVQRQHKFFAGHRSFWPDVVGGEHAKFFHRKALEYGFDVFGINIFPFFGDDHVFLATCELQMTLAVKAAEVAGQKPAVDDGFGRKFRLIQVAGHDGLAADTNFTDAVGGGIQNAHFHPGQRLADSVRAKGFQIVDGDRRARFRKSVSVGDGNAQVVEKLQRLRFTEGAANNDRAKLSAKRFVNLLQQEAADPEARTAFCHRFVQANQSFENSAFARRQRIETCLQALLQIFQDEGNETYVSDFVFWKSFAHIFWAQRTQTQRHRLHCLLIWNRRPSEGLHDDARKLLGAVRRA